MLALPPKPKIFPLTPYAPCQACVSNPDQITRFDGFISVYCPHFLAGSIVYTDENGDFYALSQSHSPVTAEVWVKMLAAGKQAGEGFQK